MKLSTFIFIFSICFASSATAQFQVITDINLPSGGNYDGSSSNGFYVTTTNLGDPWLVNTSGNMSANNNSGSGVYARFGEMKIKGTSGGDLTFNIIGNNDGVYAEDTAITGSQNDTGIFFENMNVNSSSNSQSGLFAAFAGIISVKGSNSVVNKLTVNNNQYGIIAKGNQAKVEIENMDIEVKNNSYYGIISWVGDSVVKISGNAINKNKMVLEDNVLYAIASYQAGSIFNIKKMDIFVKNNKFALVEDTASLDFYDSNIRILDNSDGIYINQSGKVTLNNTNFYTDYNLFHTDNVGLGSLTASNGILQGSIYSANNTAKVDFTDINWSMLHDSNIKEFGLHSSTIDLRSKTAGTYNTITLTDYDTTNSTIILNTSLGDDSSLTDKIVINGSITGSTILDIKGSGSGDETVEGIKIVDLQNGATSQAYDFSLKGGSVDGGAYEYKLFKGNTSASDTESFFLRSTKQLTNVARTIANAPALLLSIAKVGNNSLHKRLGEIRNNPAEGMNGAWIRQYSNNLHIDDKISSKMDLSGIEVGYDHRIYNDCKNKILLGAMIGYLSVDNVKTYQSNGYQGSGHGKSPSVGVYATLINHSGWFADATARTFFDSLHMASYSSNGDVVKFNPRRQITMFSLEGGRKFEFAHNQDRGNFFTMEPKAEFTYGFAKADEFRTSNSNYINYGRTESLTGKISLDLGYNYVLKTGSKIEPFIRVGAINEFSGKTDIMYAGTNYESDLSGTSFEFGGGVNSQINKNMSIYSEIMHEKGSVIQSTNYNIGLRYNW